MILSHLGVIVDILWNEIPNHTSFVELGDFVVIPNHIHGILILNKPKENVNVDDLETLHATSLQPPSQPSAKNGKMAIISPKSHSISTIIRSYKSAVTKHANQLGLENGWQSRFYDHIIRNEKSHKNISQYIQTNPEHWSDDDLFGKNSQK